MAWSMGSIFICTDSETRNRASHSTVTLIIPLLFCLRGVLALERLCLCLLVCLLGPPYCTDPDSLH